MPDNESKIDNKEINSVPGYTKTVEPIKVPEKINQSPAFSSSPKWINNKGEEVKQVFGFNENAELVNARVAMIGFLMLILTELAFAGEPATQKIFGIN
tara:strand:- start:303 stop:596 length:294 start_codon:yes stop_codon:yes gene_type:complete